MRTMLVSMLLVFAWSLPVQAVTAAPVSDHDLAGYAAKLLERAYPDGNAPGAAVLVARGRACARPLRTPPVLFPPVCSRSPPGLFAIGSDPGSPTPHTSRGTPL